MDHFLLGAPILFSLIYFLFPLNDSAKHIYRSPHISYLNSRVSTGPFKGLYSTEKAVAHVEEINRQLASLKETHKTFFFFPRMPAGYLFLDEKGHTPATWVLEPEIMTRDFIRTYFDKNGLPDVIFISKRKPKWSKEEFWQEPLSENDYIIMLAKGDQYSNYYSDENMEIYSINSQ